MNDHEIRLALVLNGGVSLAVWMGGVAHELDLARRAAARSGAAGPQKYDEELADRWAELCARHGQHRRLMVDVIAGTSAGGLNGSLLATAIANGSSLDPPDVKPGPWLRQRWSELGALEAGKLLPSSEAGSGPRSILDGGFFLDELGKALGVVRDAGDPQSKETVTLFVTASGLGDQQFVVEDATRQRFEVADHRYLFRFSNEERVRYAAGGTYTRDTVSAFTDTDLLARASRCSASFPAAFEPISETDELTSRPPRVRPRWNHPMSWLVDGGVLDNAPFRPVLDVVARRPVTGRATRYILYVVPSSGASQTSAKVESADRPGWRTAVLSAVNYPREIDFRSNIEHLEQLLMEADAAWSDTQRLFDRCVTDAGERRRVIEAARLLQPAYRYGRAAGGVWEAVSVAHDDRTTVLDATSALSSSDVDEILAEEPAWIPHSSEQTAVTVPGPNGLVWPWGTGPAERVVRLILRSLRSRIDQASADTSIAADVQEWESALTAASDIIQRVLAVRDAVTEAVASKSFDLADGSAAVAAGVNSIFSDLHVPAALGTLLVELQEHVPVEQVEAALAVEIVSRCTAARAPHQRSAPFRFLRLGPDVALPLLAGHSAASLASELGDRILYGTQVGHFGAFGAVKWRQWDWLMGRLHAVVHLGSLLGADEQWIRQTQLLVLKAEGWTLDTFVGQIHDLANDFPGTAGTKALATMRNELNETVEGRQTVQGLADRLVAVSSGLGPQAGRWIRAVAARDESPDSRLVRWARWFTEPARETLWRHLVKGVTLSPSTRPTLLGRWPALAALAVAAALIAIAVVIDAGPGSVALATLAGLAVASGAGLLIARRAADRARAQLRQRVNMLVPAIPESGQSAPR